MSRLLRCSNGHQWESFPEGGPSALATPLICPVCGARENDVLSPPTLVLRQSGDPGETPHPTGNLRGSGLPVIEGYEIQEELGRGAMGIVYKARHLPTDRLVALKVIRTERQANAEVIRRFRREAQATARLSHPNIVAVYEFDQSGETHFLAMEYVPGVTLQRLVEDSGPLPVPLACDVIRQTALGLQHAVEQALVHRDIKPSNLMLVLGANGAIPTRPLVKVVDMGVARLYQLREFHEDSLTTLTRDGAVIGTPDYIAPEQLENPHEADIRADLYSLGCTFYFLLSGKVPFPGGTLIQKLDRQRWQTAASVDQLRADVPPGVAAVVRRLMAKHPDDRYRTPAELVAALDQLMRTGELPTGHQPARVSEVRCYRGHKGAVIDVVSSRDGTTMVSAGADRMVRVWYLASGKELRSWGPVAQDIGCLAVSPLADQVLTGQGVSVRIWDGATGRERGRLNGHSDAVRALSISADGRLILTGGDDRMLRLWDLASGREVGRLVGHRGRITSAALSPDGQLAVSGDRDQSLRLWDVASCRELRSFAVPRGLVQGVAFAPDGRTVLSGHFDTTLRLWETSSGRELRRFTGHRQMVARVGFAANGRYLLSCSADQTVRAWDPDSGAELCCCQGHTGPALSLEVLPSGWHVLSCSQDETIRLWQLPD
jgi:eukaryotic-like serine/threonine-protein kinase